MKRRLTKDEIFDSIYESYALDVYHACLHLTKNDDLAQEMTQQAFVKFFECYETNNPKCVKAYLIRIARNLTLNYYRHAKYEVQNIDNDEEDDSLKWEPATESLEEAYFQDALREMKVELTADILANLKGHHEGWYEIIHMMFYMEKSHDEIAEELGITKDVLYSRLRRAKLWIRKNYEERFKNIEDLA